MRKALVFTLVSAGVAVTAVFACGVDDLNLENRACPCGPGYVCDTPHNVCVKPEVLLDGAIFVGEAAVNPPPAPPPDDSGAPPCKGDECSCLSDTDCVDPNNPKCSGGRCVQCVTTPADNCSVGSYCVASTNICAPGCKADTECAALSPTAPRCNTTRHQCVQCAGDGDCTAIANTKCSPSGQCATGCFTDGGACDDGGICCGGLCIDGTSDPLNCNGCGLACSGGATNCCAGTCSNPLTDKNNCSKCGAPCDSTVNNTGSSCSSGKCNFTCTSGWGHCSYGSGNNNTGCPTNLTTSTSHCGSCNTDCGDQVHHAQGTNCTNSTCGYTSCSSGYYELDGKLYDGCESCGSSGQWCCPGNTCPTSGTCEPAPGGDGHCH